MSFLSGMKGGRRFGAVALAVIVGGAVACRTDVADMQFQEGDYIFDFLADGSLTGGTPAGTGTILGFTISAVDPSQPDAFSRAVEGTSAGYDTDGTDFGPGWNFGGFERNSTNDPRLPALTSSTGVMDPADGFVIGDPAEVGGDGFHNPFTEGAITGLLPSSTYIVAFFRYGLTQNGALDAEDVMLGDAVTPDQLVPMGGSPAGDPNLLIESFPTFVPFQADANPYIVGMFTTNASGVGAFDAVIDGSGGELYQTQSGDPSDADFDLSLVARNDDTQTTFPRYNYLVILEGPAVDAADAADNPQAMRIQMGQDMDASTGAPINNAYAPFPPRLLTEGELLALPVAAGQANELQGMWTDLAGLAGSVYQVWLYNEETGDMISPIGDWSATDSAGAAAGSASGVNSFNSQADWTHTFTTSDALAGQSVGPYTQMFLSIESGLASNPSNVQPLWWSYTDMAGDPADPFGWSFDSDVPFLFGTYSAGGDEVAWSPVGRGEGGYWGTECNAVDGGCAGPTNTLVVIFRNLQLPPVGYFYEAWQIDDTGQPIASGQLSMSMEEEGGGSLFDVDIDPALTVWTTTDGLLLVSETRTGLEDLGGLQFYDMAEYRLMLQPKAGTGSISPTTTLGGFTPEPLKERKPVPEPAG